MFLANTVRLRLTKSRLTSGSPLPKNPDKAKKVFDRSAEWRLSQTKYYYLNLPQFPGHGHGLHARLVGKFVGEVDHGLHCHHQVLRLLLYILLACCIQVFDRHLKLVYLRISTSDGRVPGRTTSIWSRGAA